MFHRNPYTDKKTDESIGSLVDKILSHLKMPPSDEKPSDPPDPTLKFTGNSWDAPDAFWTKVVARGSGDNWQDRAKQHQQFSTASPEALVSILNESVILQSIDDLSWVNKATLDQYMRRLTCAPSRISAIMKAVESGRIDFRERPDGSMEFRIPLQTAEVSDLTQKVKKLEGQVSSLTSQLADKESELRRAARQRLQSALDKDDQQADNQSD